MLLGEMDEFLEAHGFIRVALEMTQHFWGTRYTSAKNSPRLL
jgi:hypothetical protein